MIVNLPAYDVSLMFTGNLLPTYQEMLQCVFKYSGSFLQTIQDDNI
jgi:hypothetical protein